jgi:acyl carrier protein
MIVKQELELGLKSLIEETLEIEIKNNEEIIDIDSYTMMLIITYADEKYNVQLDMETLDFDQFNSINSLTNLFMSH